MLTLFRFLYKNAFIVYFLVLEIIAFTFIFQENPYQRAIFLNSSDAFIGRTYLFFDDVVRYLNLKEVNEYVARENSDLKNLDISYYRKSFDRNIVYRDSSYAQEFVFTSARIIRNSTNHRNNYLTLSRGRLQGIEPGMGVISHLGVIGIIIEASRNFSAVLSILNKEARISAKVQKNGYFGSVTWDGQDYRIGQLEDIPNHISLVEGDTIMTSGFSGIFPAGVPIGTVETVSRVKGSGFLNVEIRFTEDYRNVSYVHVVKYLQNEERKALESKIPFDG